MARIWLIYVIHNSWQFRSHDNIIMVNLMWNVRDFMEAMWRETWQSSSRVRRALLGVLSSWIMRDSTADFNVWSLLTHQIISCVRLYCSWLVGDDVSLSSYGIQPLLIDHCSRRFLDNGHFCSVRGAKWYFWRRLPLTTTEPEWNALLDTGYWTALHGS